MYRVNPDSYFGLYKSYMTIGTKIASGPAEMPLSSGTLTKLSTNGPAAKQQYIDMDEALQKQGFATTESQNSRKVCAMFISHFLQVFFLGIERGKYNKSELSYFKIDQNSRVLPPLGKKDEVLSWGEVIIEGDAKRIANGYAPMANPTAAEVQTSLNAYKSKLALQTTAKDKYDKEQEEMKAIYDVALEAIIAAWDELEFFYRNETPASKRRNCREWGVVYATHPGEEPEDETDVVPPTT